MPVNFFNAHHTQSNQEEFGLYDKPDPAKEPAYILETNRIDWIGIVKNPNRVHTDFYGIDHNPAVTIYKDPPANRERESACDGILRYENKLTFVELKNKTGSGWVAGATDQLLNTVRLFAANHTLDEFDNVSAHICNKARPNFSFNYVREIERFSKETASLRFKAADIGLTMRVKQDINI